MLPSRCLRCGAVSRELVCASCVDYLVAYRPLWLDPSLLPGPSLLDLLGPRETAVLSTDGTIVEWRSSAREPSPEDAVRLVELLGLESDTSPVFSVGDAEVLHAFLGRGRRETPTDPGQRSALAALYRHIAARDWMPPHLAEEYRLRAHSLAPLPEEVAGPVVVSRAKEELPAPSETVEAEMVEPEPLEVPPEPEEAEPAPEEILPSSVEDAAELESPLPAPEPGPPEPAPEPEPPLPLPPEPIPEPPPEPEPEPEERAREEAEVATRAAELARVKEQVERERKSVEAWVQARTEEITTKEKSLLERERVLEAQAREVETARKTLETRLLAAEKDEARREALSFLASIPGMTEDEANVIATAFPDMASLRAADAKALTQCQGVTEAIARAIRYELVPGEVEEEQRAIDLREEAQAFLEEGDYRASLECYNRLLVERPEDVGLWFDKAELLVLLDQSDEALQCYNRVLDLDRKNRQAWFERANLLFGMGHLADAVDALREALKIDTSKSGDLVLKAEQLRRDGHGNEAAILFQAILDVDPENTRAVLGLGDTLLDLGDFEAAEGLLTRALGKGAQNPQILFRKGELLRRKGRWGAAVQFFNRAITLQWDYPDPWMAKGEILLEHDRAQEALECFDKVLSFDVKRADAWARKALAHHAVRQGTAATKAIEEAVRLDPDDSAVVAARSALAAKPAPVPGVEVEGEVAPELEQEAPDEAAEKPGARDAVPPSFAEAWKEAVDEEEEKRPEETAEISADFKSFVESVEPEKEDVHVLLQLAELALEGGDAEMALLRYQQAVEREPRSADAWTGKGTALQQLERYQEALEAYNRALELAPDHELARRWRETCLRHLRKEGRT